jgi:alpha-glucuronidase
VESGELPLSSSANGAPAVVTVAGASQRGVLYGVGAFLRKMDWGKGRLSLEAGLTVESKPASAIRGIAWVPVDGEQLGRMDGGSV